MNIDQKHLRAIEEMVEHYCSKHDLIPRKQEICVSISFRPKREVFVSQEPYKFGEADPEVLESKIMDGDAYRMLQGYLEEMGSEKGTITRVLNSVKHCLGAYNTRPKVRDVVYYGDANDVDSSWRRTRNTGNKILQHIDNWLNSLGLKRLGTPPH